MKGAIVVVFTSLMAFQLAAGLSYSVCDTIAEEWTTDTPRLTGSWPYYNLLHTCSGNLNVEGFGVDACVRNGTKCGQAAADAFCQYLGFDKNAPGLYSTVVATAPALSMTGEWCTSPGQYAQLGHPNRTEFDTIKAANAGPYCSALDSVTCIRTRGTLSQAVTEVGTAAASAPASAPSASARVPPGAAYLVANTPVATAGRRMKAVAKNSIVQA